MPKIMFIDDDPRTLKLLSFLFSSKGFKPTCIKDGAEALDRILTDAPDVIVQDLSMPGMDGMELLQSIKAINSSIPVIVLSARNDMKTRSETIESGAYAHLGKPFKPIELYNKVAALVNLPNV